LIDAEKLCIIATFFCECELEISSRRGERGSEKIFERATSRLPVWEIEILCWRDGAVDEGEDGMMR
jgi:hypothetical protein